MPAKRAKKPPLPIWAWLFAVLCFAIPVVALGGAIPAALGVGGGFYCLAVAREAGKTNQRKLVHCTAVTVVCWILFMGLAGGVMALRNRFPDFFRPGPRATAAVARQVTDPAEVVPRTADRQKNTPPVEEMRRESRTADHQEKAPLGEEKRREIYAWAVSMREHLESAHNRRSDRMSRGRDTGVVDSQIDHIEGMQESRLEFLTRFHDISRQQLDEIVAEGDRNHWPTD